MLVHDLGVFALAIGSGLLGCAVRVGAVSRFEGGGTTMRPSTRGATHCDDCESHYARVTGFVHVSHGGPTLAAYYAVCHGHPEHEVAFDLILGTWGDDDPGDHETFSCLLRPYRSRFKPYAVMALDPFLTLNYGDGDEIPAWMGRQMSREDALQSPRINTVWAIVDALAATVDPITEQVRTYNGRRTARPAGSEPV